MTIEGEWQKFWDAIVGKDSESEFPDAQYADMKMSFYTGWASGMAALSRLHGTSQDNQLVSIRDMRDEIDKFFAKLTQG